MAPEVHKVARELLGRHLRRSKALQSRLVAIADRYWKERRHFDRIPAREVRKAIAPIEKAAKQLEVALQEAPGFARAAIILGLSIRPDLLNNISDGISSLLRACKVAGRISGKAGARKKAHIQHATAELIAVWTDHQSERFVRSFGTALGSGQKERFVHDGPNFVHQVLSAIDPEISIEEVGTALKVASVKQKPLRNSSAKKR